MKIFKYSLMIFLFFVTMYIGVYLYAFLDDDLNINSANSYYLYDKDNNLYSGMISNEWITIDKMSKHIINATISIEDKNFYNHYGFDYLRIMKALYINMKEGETKQGASTISQQYVKNLFLDFDKTWERKINEAWLTIRLETHYTKDEILEGYLNTINYGGIFGIENAAKYYFGKSASDLSLAESTILVGIPKSPSNYSPTQNYDKAKERQLLILNSMVKNEYITEKEKNDAYREELIFIGKLEESNLKTLMYYENAVMAELKTLKEIPSSFLATGGLKIYTNLDMEAQESLENNINKYLDDNELQVASVMTDPKTGKIIALVGGRDYSKSQFNRAISAKRHVGSSIKPFLYYAALESGFTPSTTFTSSKTTFVFADNQTYSPNNYNDKYPDKPISMAAALAYSDNIYAVKTHLFLGEDVLVSMAKRVGIEDKLEALPSLALGSADINIIDMITGYNTLASGGVKMKPYLIEKVEDINGNILYIKKEEKEAVLNEGIVFVLNEMMANTYSTDFIDYSYPTCVNIAYKLTNKYAIKSGTTETDSLIFGYNNDVLLGIWLGYDDNKSIANDTGTSIKNIWADTVETYLNDKDSEWYVMPSNVIATLVEPISGEVATANSKRKKFVYYIKGTEPTIIDSALDSLIPTLSE